MTTARWTKEQYEAYKGMKMRAAPNLSSFPKMNKVETTVAYELEALKRKGEITFWAYESIKLRLADRTWYTPDFFVIWHDGTAEFIEVKGGFVRDDARVKYKVAKEMWGMYKWTWRQIK